MNLTRFHSRISEVITYTKLEPTTLSSTLLFGEISYNLILLYVGGLGPNLEQEELEGENRKGLKRLDSHGQVRGDLNTPAAPRPVGAAEPYTRSHLTAEILSSKQSLLRDAATSMKIRSAVLEGPRNPGRWPVLRKPPKLHARENSGI